MSVPSERQSEIGERETLINTRNQTQKNNYQTPSPRILNPAPYTLHPTTAFTLRAGEGGGADSALMRAAAAQARSACVNDCAASTSTAEAILAVLGPLGECVNVSSLGWEGQPYVAIFCHRSAST